MRTGPRRSLGIRHAFLVTCGIWVRGVRSSASSRGSHSAKTPLPSIAPCTLARGAQRLRHGPWRRRWRRDLIIIVRAASEEGIHRRMVVLSASRSAVPPALRAPPGSASYRASQAGYRSSASARLPARRRRWLRPVTQLALLQLRCSRRGSPLGRSWRLMVRTLARSASVNTCFPAPEALVTPQPRMVDGAAQEGHRPSCPYVVMSPTDSGPSLVH